MASSVFLNPIDQLFYILFMALFGAIMGIFLILFSIITDNKYIKFDDLTTISADTIGAVFFGFVWGSLVGGYLGGTVIFFM